MKNPFAKKAVVTNKRQLSLLPTTARLRQQTVEFSTQIVISLPLCFSYWILRPPISWSPLNDEFGSSLSRGLSLRRHPEEPWATKDPAKQEQTAPNGINILPSTLNRLIWKFVFSF